MDSRQEPTAIIQVRGHAGLGQVAIGQTVRDEHILDRLGKQRKCNLPKKKKRLGLGYKREKSKIFFNKVYSGIAKGEGAGGEVEWSLGLADASH